MVKIETVKYFSYLIGLVTGSGGTLELGRSFARSDIAEMSAQGHLVNCLGNNAGSVGGAGGEYYSNPGEVRKRFCCYFCFTPNANITIIIRMILYYRLLFGASVRETSPIT